MLKEALLKKERGEELTEEEKALLQQFDELLIETNSKIKLLEEEKELNSKKFETANEELQSKLKELAEISSELETTKSEKASFMKLLEDEKTSVAIKEEMAKLEAERKLKQEQENKEKETKEVISRYETSLKTLQEEMERIKHQNDIMSFKYEVSKKREEYPYLEEEITTILNEVDTKGIELSRNILEFLIKSKNHDEEMKKYLAKKNAGSSIFKTSKTKDKVKEEVIDPKYSNFKGLNIDLIKEYGFVPRR